jgi:hypothetical protein
MWKKFIPSFHFEPFDIRIGLCVDRLYDGDHILEGKEGESPIVGYWINFNLPMIRLDWHIDKA